CFSSSSFITCFSLANSLIPSIYESMRFIIHQKSGTLSDSITPRSMKRYEIPFNECEPKKPKIHALIKLEINKYNIINNRTCPARYFDNQFMYNASFI